MKNFSTNSFLKFLFPISIIDKNIKPLMQGLLLLLVLFTTVNLSAQTPDPLCADPACAVYDDTGMDVQRFDNKNGYVPDLDQTFPDYDGAGTELNLTFSAPSRGPDPYTQFDIVGDNSCNDIALRYWEPQDGAADEVKFSYDSPQAMHDLMVGGFRELTGSPKNQGVMHVYAFDGPNCTGSAVVPQFADPNDQQTLNYDSEVPTNTDPVVDRKPITIFTGQTYGAGNGNSVAPIGTVEAMWCGDHFDLKGTDGNRPWVMLDFGGAMVQSLRIVTHSVVPSTQLCTPAMDIVEPANNSVYIGPPSICPMTDPVLDVALNKKLKDPAQTNVSPGDVVSYDIEVFNQGTENLIEVSIIDYIPAGYTFAPNNNWTADAQGAVLDATVANGLLTAPGIPAGGSMVFPIELTIAPGATAATVVNVAEITAALDDTGLTEAADPDSTADTVPDNDPGADESSVGNGADDAVDGDGTGAVDDGVPGTDEDDADPATVVLAPNFMDAALAKELKYPGTPPVSVGDIVTYNVIITNQGTDNLTEVSIIDYIPAGYTFAPNNNWTADAQGAVLDATVTNGLLTTPGIAPGASVAFPIELTVVAGANATNLVNQAEITAAKDENGLVDDVDSTPDTTPDNDPGSDASSVGNGADNEIDGDGTGATDDGVAGTDEDDADPATVPLFDLALDKKIDASSLPSDGMFDAGDVVMYNITVFNQGNIDALQVEIEDAFPCGLTLMDNTWTPSTLTPGPGTATNTILSIPAGTSVIVPITFVVKSTAELLTDCMQSDEPFLNFAQIKSALLPDESPATDFDSTPNSNFPEELAVVPNEPGDNDVMSTGKTEIGSEDDHDPANLDIFDLALMKTLKTPATAAELPVAIGAQVTFEICIFNQGNVDADEVTITDVIPAGYTYDAASDGLGWSDLGGGIAEITLTEANGDFPTGNLEFLEMVCKDIIVTLNATGPYVNIAEISGAVTEIDGTLTPVTQDNDSKFDADVTNDGGGLVGSPADDTVDGDGNGAIGDGDAAGDEDNQDPAQVPVVDFALQKTTATTDPVKYGEIIDFTIEVFNQGTVPGKDFVINDYVPAGFEFDPAINPLWDAAPVGASQTVTATLAGPIMPGMSETIVIKLKVLNTGSGMPSDYTNHAEIGMVAAAEGGPVAIGGLIEPGDDISGFDIDSTPDATNGNDPGADTNNAGSEADNVVDGDGMGADGDGVGATDEDDADPALVEVADAALVKVVLTPKPYGYGDPIEFGITITNQGTIPLTDVKVSDYVPAGYSFVTADNTADGWMGTDGVGPLTVETTIAGPIAPGSTADVSIFLILEMTNDPAEYINVAEISEMKNDMGVIVPDADSTPDNMPDNDAGGEVDTPTDDVIDEDPMVDEDDSDPAVVEIVDLALTKTTTETGPFTYGQSVTFTINVRNQGTVDATDILITDYIPAGFSYNPANDVIGWSHDGSAVGGNAEYTIAGPLAAGDITMVDIMLIIEQSAGGDDTYTNVAEITSFNDLDGLPIGEDDIDSTPDDMPGNDPGGVPNSPTDNIMNGDGVVDEDDHDPELIEIFDLALQKHTMNVTGFSFGDEVTFMIDVTNQGNVTAIDVEVTDYIPSGFSLAPASATAGWTDNGDMTATWLVPGPLAGGATETIDIILVVEMTTMDDDHVNYAEISSAIDENGNTTADGSLIDVDSTPDTDNTDPGGVPLTDTDDVWDNENGDEDDHDPALIQVIDIALMKVPTPGQAPVKYGEPFSFDITVINQGNETLQDIEVTDYIPTGMTPSANLDNGIGGTWTVNGDMMTTVIPGPLNGLVGNMITYDEVTLTVEFIVDHQAAPIDGDAWTNFAEVSAMDDTAGNPVGDLDIDSQADNDPDNDNGGELNGPTDDVTNEDGTMGGDEDDHDPAAPMVWDLALTKIMTPDAANPNNIYVFGDEIPFTITVTNQGNETVTNVEITEYIPPSLTEVGATNTGWTFAGDMATFVVPGPLAPGETVDVELNMIFQVAPGGIEDYVNIAEISEFANEDGTLNTTDNPDMIVDADSTPDNDVVNDAGGEPDFPGTPSGTDNTIDNEMGDEDDQDPVLLGFVDMALVKRKVTTGPVKIGQDVTFSIEVINQGNTDMTDIKVVDYIPEGFVLSTEDINGWSVDGDGNVVNTVAGPLSFGESETLMIVLTVQPNANAQNLVNVAELAEFFFETGIEATEFDVDSDADTMKDNDAGGEVYTQSDNAEEGDGTGMPGGDDPATDEDDQDPAVPDVLDLALIKTTMHTAAVRPGDIVTFDIEVCNQGNIAVQNVKVHDIIPSGMILSGADANGWTSIDASTASNVITDVIDRDACITLQIDLEILPNVNLDELINVAEIVEVFDLDENDITDADIDSTPNDDNGEAANTYKKDDDDSTAGSVNLGEDSDDADPAAPPVFDLAIQKKNVTIGSSSIGDIVKFEIEVFNQGNISATDIVVTDYIPAGLGFAAAPGNAGWTPAAGSDYEYALTDTIGYKESVVIELHLELLAGANPMNVVNMSEISAANDTFGVDHAMLDIDSDFDANNDDKGNDLYSLEDDKLNESGLAGGDEDDHDQAWVDLCDGMGCKGAINLSIDQSCTGFITPVMILAGDLYPDTVYTISIKDENGNDHPNMFGLGDVNKTFEVSISNRVCGDISCWLPVTVEYKFKPVIECSNDTLSCTQAFDDATIPDVSGNCSTVDVQLVFEDQDPMMCDPLYTAMLTRKYVAVDTFGNVSDTCTQEILLERTNLDSIKFPIHRMVATTNPISCSAVYPKVPGTNYPMPSYSGVPTLTNNGVTIDLFEFEASLICNGYVDFEDEPIANSTSCVTKFKRTWTVGEWHCDDVKERTFTQIIEIVDFEGPSITCPSNITISTGTFDCSAMTDLELPSVSDACNTIDRIDVSTGLEFITGYTGQVVSLPVGTNTITYTAYDLCGKNNQCSYTITVQDNSDPIAICDQFTTVGIALDTVTYVSAVTIDDGSFDECGPVTLSVARMDSGLNPSDFGPTASIYCADAGSEIMVALLVTDAGGNTNMCMVTVEVQDKVDAKMTCPADTTVSCNFAYDPDNLNDFFDKPEVYGNCPSSNKMVQTLSGSLSDCGSGTLIRHISLRNAQNVEVDKCNQTIVFENGDPLTYADITWPSSDVDLNGCGVTDITSGMIGIPEIADKDCQLIGINVKSDTFFFAENNSNLPIGACLKIIRKYSVVDWCKNDGPGSLSDPFKFTQIIKLNNTVDPTIANVFVAKTFKSSDVNCGPMTIAAGELTAIASDDCTATSDLVTSYTVYDADDNVVKIGNGLDAAGTYAVGTYTVQFKALDKCGNDALTSSTFTIINVKSPTPYCRNGLSTTLIAMDPDNDGNLVEMVMLTPDFFDAGSSHTCGGPVQLSFSADVVDVTASFFCSDTIAPVEVEIWVTDQNGNQDYCVTYLDVQNNDTIDLCNSQKPVTIAGRIYTEEDAQLEDAEVELRSFESVLAMTNDNGLYEFADMPIGGNYKVIPQKDNDLMNGVSTLDLVLIQRHILEIALLDSPYKVLAADINNSESVTASDLAALRKAILGVSNSFPNNTSWRFIDESYTFEDDLDPWTAPLPEKYNIANLSEDMNVDFIAVKVGDINGNVTTNLQAGVVAESRSDNSMTMSLPNIKVETGAVYEIEIQATDATNIFGIQHTFDMNGLELIDMKSGQFEITNNNVYQSSSLLNVSYASAHGHAVNAGNRLFTMIVKATKDGQLQDMISLSNKGLNAESYLGDNIEVSNINIEWRAIEEDNIAAVSVMTVDGNSPNPWKTQTTISFELPEAGKVTLKMTDAMGRLISTKEGNFKGGFNNFIINDQDVKAGIILYELKYNNQVINKKMIKVN